MFRLWNVATLTSFCFITGSTFERVIVAARLLLIHPPMFINRKDIQITLGCREGRCGSGDRPLAGRDDKPGGRIWAAMASYDAALYRFREALDRWSGGCMDDDSLKLLKDLGL